MYRGHPQQLDLPRSSNLDFLSIPRTVPGRLNTDDFVFIKWYHNINPNEYTVIISSNDTAGPTYRSIGPLKETVELPWVSLDAYAVIGVIPNTDETKPNFWARLNRGSTYHIPKITKPGTYTMNRHGFLSAAVDTSDITHY